MNNLSERSFWIVSPNVGNQSKYWTDMSIKHKAAFMGWGPNQRRPHNQIGYKFAYIVRPGDILLIARRHHNKPELVGLGAVVDTFRTHLTGLNPKRRFGSLRLLRPFKSLVSTPAPNGIIQVLRQHKALRELKPQNKKHRSVCVWMQRQLGLEAMVPDAHPNPAPVIRLAPLHHKGEPEYEYRTRKQVKTAVRKENRLVSEYQGWLGRSGRKLNVVSYKGLRCDAYEQDRANLIEAKCATKREYIRMAVGQLLDYSYLGEEQFDKPNLAILVPKRPKQALLDWLATLNIYAIWKEHSKFKDNAEGRFT